MDKILAKMVETVWGRNILYTVLGSLGGAIIWLVIENKRLYEARNTEQINHAKNISIIRDYYEAKIDTINQRHLGFVQAALKRLEQIQNKKK